MPASVVQKGMNNEVRCPSTVRRVHWNRAIIFGACRNSLSTSTLFQIKCTEKLSHDVIPDATADKIVKHRIHFCCSLKEIKQEDSIHWESNYWLASIGNITKWHFRHLDRPSSQPSAAYKYPTTLAKRRGSFKTKWRNRVREVESAKRSRSIQQLTPTRKKPVASQLIPVVQSNPLILTWSASYKPIVKKAIKIR